MSLNDTERETVVRLQLQKAHSNFLQIELLQKAGYWDNIANRLYYSLFHAVSALLINDGHSVGSHACVASAAQAFFLYDGVIHFCLTECLICSYIAGYGEG